jgi:DnaJ-class molecular chaperone
MALEILDGEILGEREPLWCGDCDGAGEVALSSTSDDARPCPTCNGSGIATEDGR